MPAASLQLKKRYTRSDPNGGFPVVTGRPDLQHNRIGLFWRPIVDLTDNELAPLRLRFVKTISEWLADPVEGRWSWFAIIGVAGLRHQVLRHAGLREYDCREPTELPERLQTPQWATLVNRIERFGDLDYYARSLVVFQLAQLSYCQFVFKLAGLVMPSGDPVHDRYAYDVARVHGRYPGHTERALTVFAGVAQSPADNLLGLAACAQGIGHALRNNIGVGVAHEFEGYAKAALARGLVDDWHSSLVRSRYHRALALLRLAEKDQAGMRRDLELAAKFSAELLPGLPDGPDKQVAIENRRILVESMIRATGRARGEESDTQVRRLCEEILRLDPYCVEARLVAADGYLAIGEYATAAHLYTQAGELGTASGAVGWFRAAQCYEHIGDRGGAANAMGHCLELDTTVVEAREYLERFSYFD